MAFGKDPSRLLKNVLDASSSDSGKQLPPSQLRVSLSPILAFVAAADSNPQIKAALEAAKEYAGSDAISVTSTPIKNGCAMRLEVEEGVLKAIGGAVKGSAALGPAQTGLSPDGHPARPAGCFAKHNVVFRSAKERPFAKRKATRSRCCLDGLPDEEERSGKEPL